MSTILFRRIIFTIRPAQKCLARSFFPHPKLILELSSENVKPSLFFRQNVWLPHFPWLIFAVFFSVFFLIPPTIIIIKVSNSLPLLHILTVADSYPFLWLSAFHWFLNTVKKWRGRTTALLLLFAKQFSQFWNAASYHSHGFTFHLPYQRFLPINSGNSGKDGE